MYPLRKLVGARRRLSAACASTSLGQAEQGPFPAQGRRVESKETTERERRGHEERCLSPKQPLTHGHSKPSKGAGTEAVLLLPIVPLPQAAACA